MITAVASLNDSLSTSPLTSTQRSSDQFAEVLASSVTGTATAGVSTTSAVAPRTILGSAVAAQLFAAPQEEQDFATELDNRLKAAGVDTSQPIQFQVQSDGSVVAKSGTADKQTIDAVLAADPALANEYRKIANTEETLAIVRREVAYQKQAQGLDSAAQSALWQSYAGQIGGIEAEGGDLTLTDAKISFLG